MPKTTRFELTVPVPIDQTRARLREKTREGSAVSIGRPFKVGKEPFRGKVGEDDFTLAQNKSANKRYLPTVRGTLTDMDHETLIRGEIGLDKTAIWAMRLSYVMGLVGAGVMAFVFATGNFPGGGAFPFPAFFILPIVISLFLVPFLMGLQVRRAESESETIVEELRALFEVKPEVAAQAQAQTRRAPQPQAQRAD